MNSLTTVLIIIRSSEKGEIDMEELRQLLLQVSDSYTDFVYGVMAVARDFPERLNDIIDYLKEHSDTNTSDFLGWLWTEVEGIDLDNPVLLEIVDDDEYEDED